jgi:ligand-binding sensor domain-containing protein/DNA-binding CsgD family transcriptional regulator
MKSIKLNRCTWFGLVLKLLLFFAMQGKGQSFIGQREIVNFSKQEYNGGTQNWAIKQDSKGRIYIANNEGLLVYNGTIWQLYPVPNNTILRSIEFGKDGKLYAGAQDEIGYFAPDPTGKLVYTSLKSLLSETEKTFADVWDIVTLGDEVFFRTSYKIFRLSNNRVIAHPPISSWLSLRKHHNQLIAFDEKAGVLTYKNGQWETIIHRESLPANFFITDMIPFGKDTSLVCTPGNGLYCLYNNTLQPFNVKSTTIGQQHFTALTPIDANHFLAGTYFNGVYLINRQGQVLENISVKSGLQNNTIRRLFCDATDNIWLGLDNGLSFIAFGNAIKHINPASFNNGGGYGVKALGNNLYFALSTGVLRLPFQQNNDFTTLQDNLQPLLEGQTWNLNVMGNNILAGRDDGFWNISGKAIRLMTAETGFWTFQQLPGSAGELIAAGNYRGIRLFENNNANYIDKGSISAFNESARYLETDEKNIWVSHPYRGVYKISLPDYSIKLFTDKDGLPSSLNNHVFKIKGKIVVATVKGIYEYDEKSGTMFPSPTYARVFGDRPIRYLKDDARGNIWFVQEKLPGVADYSSKEPVIVYISELKNRILSGFENIYPYNNQNIFIGAENGFYHINYEKYRQNIRPFKVYITAVKIFAGKDSVLYGGYDTTDSAVKAKTTAVSYTWNSFHFSYSASLYGLQPGIEYSYYLEGFDKGWSEWTKKPEKDYTNLPAGSYTFRLKAKNNSDNISDECSYTFAITPPWYRTIWSYILYAVIVVFLLYCLFRYQAKKHQIKLVQRRLADQKKYEEEQKQMAYQHQIELEKSEKEIIRLQNEKLENEITHKNAELASSAMNLVHRKEFILKLKTELQQLQKSGKAAEEMPELKKILKVLGDEEKLNDEWKQFSHHFNNVHSDFLNVLKERHPSLKPHELKLCAYLRMNLSTKEIAQLMSISVRGVEISRYRLRKKLGLLTETNLVEFLFDVNSGKRTNDEI